MAGLWRVDFKPASWLRRTRVLTPEERGVYIDIIMMIYERGEPIDDSPDDLCKELGFRYRAKLEKVLTEFGTSLMFSTRRSVKRQRPSAQRTSRST